MRTRWRFPYNWQRVQGKLAWIKNTIPFSFDQESFQYLLYIFRECTVHYVALSEEVEKTSLVREFQRLSAGVRNTSWCSSDNVAGYLSNKRSAVQWDASCAKVSLSSFFVMLDSFPSMPGLRRRITAIPYHSPPSFTITSTHLYMSFGQNPRLSRYCVRRIAPACQQPRPALLYSSVSHSFTPSKDKITQAMDRKNFQFA